MFPVKSSMPDADKGITVGHCDICQLSGRVNRFRQVGTVCLAVIVLSGCSISGDLGQAYDSENLITASVSKPVEAEGVASTDAEMIKTVVADASQDSSLAWQNPDTGNRGTIIAINDFISENGQQCKQFETTVDTFMGISLYNGETCELKKGFWVLSWFLRKNPSQ